MKLIIEHQKTKRAINGPFTFSCARIDLERLKLIINQKLSEDFTYGYIFVDEQITKPEEGDFDLIKRQRPIPNTPPVSWD